MAKVNFEKLHVYRLAEELSDEIWAIVKDWPSLARDTVGKQVVRSVDSVGANIAEGAGRRSFVDNKRFVYMARGSLYETIHWMRRAYSRKLLSQPQIERVRDLIDKLSPMLNAYVKSIGRPATARTRSPQSNASDHPTTID